MPALARKKAPPPGGHPDVLLARFTLDLTMSEAACARFDDALGRLGEPDTLARLARAVSVELNRITETTGVEASVRD